MFVSSGLFSISLVKQEFCVLFGSIMAPLRLRVFVEQILTMPRPFHTNVGDLSSLASGTVSPTVNVHTSIIRTLNGDVLQGQQPYGH